MYQKLKFLPRNCTFFIGFKKLWRLRRLGAPPRISYAATPITSPPLMDLDPRKILARANDIAARLRWFWLVFTVAVWRWIRKDIGSFCVWLHINLIEWKHNLFWDSGFPKLREIPRFIVHKYKLVVTGKPPPPHGSSRKHYRVVASGFLKVNLLNLHYSKEYFLKFTSSTK